jgi:hypothetical protein
MELFIKARLLEELLMVMARNSGLWNHRLKIQSRQKSKRFSFRKLTLEVGTLEWWKASESLLWLKEKFI